MFERIEECPVCKSSNLKNSLICKDHLVTNESFAIVTCINCGLMITNPRPTQEEIGKYYDSAQYLSHNNDDSLIGKIYALSQKYTLWYKHRLVKKLVKNPTNLLDYGCGTGQFLEYMGSRHFKVVGIEPSKIGLTKTQQKGITVFSSIDDANLINERQSIITLWHVLEHVHDLNATIKGLKKLLKKNGYMIIALPNTKSWDASHYQSNWAAYDVPRHLFHFNDSNIKTLLKQHRLSLIQKAPLYLDSFYISLLSETHQNSSNKLIKSIINGCKSNIYGSIKSQYSSMIYVFQKK